MSVSGPISRVANQVWVVREPLTTDELLAATLGLAALILDSCGLWSMRRASVARNRQLDSQEVAALNRHAESMLALEALIK